ncbi:MAG: GIY-YIG nuclease family protein [Chitinophagaceae bacterium]|nr:GIY-YIG nuclease family protein [Chitinophagaceae bacterium]
MNKCYVGACSNTERRLYEHHIGHSKFTSLGIPWKLMYTEFSDSMAVAKKREQQIKRMKSGKYIETLIAKR